MYFTYIIKSNITPGAIYIGSTKNLNSRLAQHNDPKNHGYTKRHAPWVIETYLAFSEEQDAKRFELYLKSGSGKAFMKKRLISKSCREALEKYNAEKQKVR